ncbi:MAG: UDP-N-acetylmuramate: L-alanyl-gamma-D-glutamyl-meso-diaminopimelate ligase [Bacteroidia bacterium]|jgi:UDP-N-acetylmuramate: L-alanyl-gamma-D-glutamyl-meso-diaminopimelate ligase
MKAHFIAIGGSAMHNLALALHHKGYQVTGSDDEVFEPSKGRLAKYGLLPAEMGWNETNITKDIDAVILGMHARADNPELLKAQELGLRIYSYPEYIYEQTKEKTRVVIGGSHGKTTITAMILHVLNKCGVNSDYMVGAQLAGFDTMVKLTEEAPVVILEGDEYLSSPIDRRPKFHLYKPSIALISGIAWDHVNVFPTFENYVEQFDMFVDLIEKEGKLIYCIDDAEVKKVAEESDNDISLLPYSVPPHVIENGVSFLLTDEGKIPLKVFGEHNLINLNGARLVCASLGVSDKDFYHAIQDFSGASKRLELLGSSNKTSVFKDFAHSPSKVKATVKAVKTQFEDRQLVACLELHTFSSLNLKFLEEYRKSMKHADEAIVYFNPKALKHKKLPALTKKEVKKAFARKDLMVMTDSKDLKEYLLDLNWKRKNLLMMSSGTFDGLDLNKLADKVTR